MELCLLWELWWDYGTFTLRTKVRLKNSVSLRTKIRPQDHLLWKIRWDHTALLLWELRYDYGTVLTVSTERNHAIVFSVRIRWPRGTMFIFRTEVTRGNCIYSENYGDIMELTKNIGIIMELFPLRLKARSLNVYFLELRWDHGTIYFEDKVYTIELFILRMIVVMELFIFWTKVRLWKCSFLELRRRSWYFIFRIKVR